MAEAGGARVASLSPPGRVGIVGAGLFGRFTIGAYEDTEDVSVLAVADENEASLRAVIAPGADLTRDWHTVVADERIEVIHVATPPNVRGPLVDAALGSGKSVFCEKPLALTLAEADQMIGEAKHEGVGLGVDYVMRHHPAYRFLARLAAERLAGAPKSMSFQNFAQIVPPGHWFWQRSASGGILVEHGVHFFDAFGLVAGPADRVAGRQLRESAVDVTVWYTEGAIGRFYHEFGFPSEAEYTSGVVAFERGHVEIEGWIPTRLTGALEVPPECLAELAASCGVDLTMECGDAVRIQASFPDRSEYYRRAIVAGMRDLIRRHRNPKHRLSVTAQDGRDSLALALAAQQACDTGQVVAV
jgi:predicted dehydrogenase